MSGGIQWRRMTIRILISFFIWMAAEAVESSQTAENHIHVDPSRRGRRRRLNRSNDDRELLRETRYTLTNLFLNGNKNGADENHDSSSIEKDVVRVIEGDRILMQGDGDGDDNDDEKSKYEPMRILFDASDLIATVNGTQSTNINNQYDDNANNYSTDPDDQQNNMAKVTALIDKVFPMTTQHFLNALSVIPLPNGFKIPPDICYDLFDVKRQYTYPGIQGYDLVVFVSSKRFVGNTELCPEKGLLSTLMSSAPCALNQKDRPVVGFINLCLDAIPIKTSLPGLVSEDTIDLLFDTVVHEMVHILGFNSEMYKFFRDANTGEPLTPRPFRIVNGGDDEHLDGRAVCSNTLRRVVQSSTSYHDPGGYEIVTPTLKRIAQNHYNCDTLTGMRLENQPTASMDTLGSHFDERYAFTDSMSAIYDDDSMFFTPFSLALLEDSGFYRPDYRTSV
eukprot:CAMPEP_0184856730 /NCGR_PEP_ID=MMETSP0580-20130426/1917_1 /TAXON_ID=1118495 /ORGANISM="Dactyliosolen fragilissimus" /LENGTH=448 /DNA_ID=CAMNT_0027351927 /DNA_START=121 /DNA_END=1464 /DNA_ORIENTATION=-